MAQQVAKNLTLSTGITNFNLQNFSDRKDQGEGKIVLEGLSNSTSLSHISHLNISKNQSWFAESESVDLLCDSLKRMSSLEYCNLFSSFFTAVACDKVLSAIVENR